MNERVSGSQQEEDLVLEFVFTLVHGTFAEKAAWVTGEKSKFRSRLKSALAPHVVKFDDGLDWGGANTHRARQSGGTKLAAHLKKQLEKSEGSGAKHFIVSHSHGGNVALYALRDRKLRDRIDGLVCMATPFLCLRHRILPRELIIVSIVGLIFSTFAIDFATPIGKGLYVAAITVYVALALVVLAYHFMLGNAPPKRLEELSLATLSPDRLLVIRPSGDEASGLLRASQFLSWALARVWGRLTIFWSWLFVFAVLIAMARPVIANFTGKQDIVVFYETYGAWIDPVTYVVIMAAATVLLVMVVARLVFGWDAFAWVANVETMAEDSPPGTARVLLLPPHVQDRWGLAHTHVYKREETVDAISKWVKELTGIPTDSTRTSGDHE